MKVTGNVFPATLKIFGGEVIKFSNNLGLINLYNLERVIINTTTALILEDGREKQAAENNNSLIRNRSIAYLASSMLMQRL